MASTSDLPPILLNKDAAEYLSKSLRKWSCLDCAPHGIRPVKINGRLSWKISDLQKIFTNDNSCISNDSNIESLGGGQK